MFILVVNRGHRYRYPRWPRDEREASLLSDLLLLLSFALAVAALLVSIMTWFWLPVLAIWALPVVFFVLSVVLHDR